MRQDQHHSADVLVVGAGVIGTAVAWEAVRRGLSVTVLERGHPGGETSAVAAGMLAPVSEAAFGERALLEANLASAALYPAWIDDLRRAAPGRDPGLHRCGTLLVARDRDQAEALERERAFREAEGLAVERLTPSAARRREPSLAPTLRFALAAADDHAVDPVALAGALVAAVRAGGGDLRCDTEVAGLELDGARVTGVRLAGGAHLAAEHTVLAAGCWSSDLAGLPDHARPPLRAVKGQLVRLRDPAGPGLLGSVLRSEEAYLVPRGDGRYVLGATVEERGRDTSVTAGAVWELLREAVALVPGVAELQIESLAAGLRPATPDNQPLIGPASLDGLHWATGHYRHGVLLAPLTARAVVAALTGEPVDEVVAPFAPQRLERFERLARAVPA